MVDGNGRHRELIRPISRAVTFSLFKAANTYTGGGVNWTVSGGAQLIINSGGTLDMGTDKLNLGGSFVNNGTLLATGATAPAVNFTANGTMTLGTNYNASVLAIGGGGGGAGANSPARYGRRRRRRRERLQHQFGAASRQRLSGHGRGEAERVALAVAVLAIQSAARAARPRLAVAS